MTSRHSGQKKLALHGPASAFAFAMPLAALLLSGCAAGSIGMASTGQHYHCEQGLQFSVKFVDDSALIDSTVGNDVLFRDAGGQGEGQTVYSNAVARAEFGLGASGREALLRYPLMPLVARCVRD